MPRLSSQGNTPFLNIKLTIKENTSDIRCTIDFMLAGWISSIPALVNFRLPITAMISSGVVGNKKNEWGKRFALMSSAG